MAKGSNGFVSGASGEDCGCEGGLPKGLAKAESAGVAIADDGCTCGMPPMPAACVSGC